MTEEKIYTPTQIADMINMVANHNSSFEFYNSLFAKNKQAYEDGKMSKDVLRGLAYTTFKLEDRILFELIKKIPLEIINKLQLEKKLSDDLISIKDYIRNLEK